MKRSSTLVACLAAVFATLLAGQSRRAPRHCVTGIPCGGTCISPTKTCHIGQDAAATDTARRTTGDSLSRAWAHPSARSGTAPDVSRWEYGTLTLLGGHPFTWLAGDSSVVMMSALASSLSDIDRRAELERPNSGAKSANAAGTAADTTRTVLYRGSDLIRFLNELGASGWELRAILPAADPDRSQLLFARRLS